MELPPLANWDNSWGSLQTLIHSTCPIWMIIYSFLFKLSFFLPFFFPFFLFPPNARLSSNLLSCSVSMTTWCLHSFLPFVCCFNAVVLVRSCLLSCPFLPPLSPKYISIWLSSFPYLETTYPLPLFPFFGQANYFHPFFKLLTYQHASNWFSVAFLLFLKVSPSCQVWLALFSRGSI